MTIHAKVDVHYYEDCVVDVSVPDGTPLAEIRQRAFRKAKRLKGWDFRRGNASASVRREKT